MNVSYVGITILVYGLSRVNDQCVTTRNILETGGPNKSADIALYTKTRQMTPPLNAAKAVAEI